MIEGNIEIITKRFMLKVSKTKKCWLWVGSKSSADGYGHFRLNGKTQLAHRVSYQLFKGEIPDGIEVCHECDNPSCVNPDCLFLGTHTDNMRDMAKKGRARCGELPPELWAEIHKERWANMSPEQRVQIAEKNSEVQTGREFTPEHLANLRAAHKARRGTDRSIPWNLGVPMPDETKQKVAENRTGKGIGNQNAVGNHTPHSDRLELVSAICSHCQQEFMLPPHRVGEAKYCSPECYNQSRTHNKKGRALYPEICTICGKEFLVASNRRGKAKYCNQDCYRASKSPEHYSAAAKKRWETPNLSTVLELS